MTPEKKKPIRASKLKDNLVFILVGVTIFTLTLTVFRPTLKNLLEVKLDNKNKQEKLRRLEHKYEILLNLDKVEIEKKVERLEAVFPSEKPVLNLLASLTQLAQVNKVILSDVKLNPGEISEMRDNRPQPKTKQPLPRKSILQQFTIAFNIEGKLEEIISFINQLERTAPLMRIEGISLDLKGPRANLIVRVFYQAPPKFLTNVDQPIPVLSEKEQTILAEISSYRQAKAVSINAPTGKKDPFSLP